MAQMIEQIESWNDCLLFLGGKDSRKLGHNTYVIARPNGGESFVIRYHRTNIITYFSDGRIRLDSGGWQTVTTAQRFNACSPFGVSFSEKDGGVGSPNGDGAGFRDGMTSDPDGGWQEHKAQIFESRKGRGLAGYYPRQKAKPAPYEGDPIRCRFTSKWPHPRHPTRRTRGTGGHTMTDLWNMGDLPEDIDVPEMRTRTVTNSAGRDFLVRIVTRGGKYGLRDCLTHNKSDPLVEFYDKTYRKGRFAERGQFVSRYYLSTLNERRDEERGLGLDGGVSAWVVTAENVREALGFAEAGQ